MRGLGHNKARILSAAFACMIFTATGYAASFQIGDAGTEIVEVQQALADLGYDVVVDGDFGPGTAAA